MNNKTTSRINLWSSPRNISTALMYSFAQRADMSVVDEPLYAHYLSHSDAAMRHPGHAEVLDSQSPDATVVVREVLKAEYSTEKVLFKQMTHHLINIDRTFLYSMKNVLLIRDPRLIINSYQKVIPHPQISDIGVKMQYDLLGELKEKSALHAVVDARQLLLNPTKVLSELCQRLELPFDDNMLQWSKGARVEDGVWAKYWYDNVHNSTGFKPWKDREIELSEENENLAQACQPYYEALIKEAILA